MNRKEKSSGAITPDSWKSKKNVSEWKREDYLSYFLYVKSLPRPLENKIYPPGDEMKNHKARASVFGNVANISLFARDMKFIKRDTTLNQIRSFAGEYFTNNRYIPGRYINTQDLNLLDVLLDALIADLRS